MAAPDVSLLGDDIISSSDLHPNLPVGAGPLANGSLALQALYENNAVECAFSYHRPDADDDDDEDEDKIWEDNMDPITFARYYAAFDPAMA